MIKGSPWDTMQKWAEEYGGIYSFELFGELSISVSDPEILQGILQKQYNNFKKVVTITSGEKTLEALLEMQKQNKFQADEIYTLFPFEL